jgi:hypothetical protein
LKKLLLIVLSLALAGFLFWRITGGGNEPPRPEADPNFFHTAQGAHYRINELRTSLAEAMERGDYTYIHDNMYYLEGLVDAMADKLAPPERARLEDLLNRIKGASEHLDNVAGREDAKATREGLDDLFKLMEELDAAHAGTPASTRASP